MQYAVKLLMLDLSESEYCYYDSRTLYEEDLDNIYMSSDIRYTLKKRLWITSFTRSKL